MTAYHAAPQAEAVAVLEKSWVGDPAAASFGLTRSAHNGYRDPEDARLAFEARRLWLAFRQALGERLLADCGCLNLAKRSVTPDLDSTRAVQSFAILEQLQLRREAFSATDGMTSSQTMRSYPARSRARRRCLPASGGAAPDISSPRGWGRCSLS